ncbi:hypothetical protein [Clostridium sp. DJ247]|uniref:hypothetical protein n=1 Tax=Clostridium sp. DJ247 TaxID=2726188 RepID=UPI001625BCDA|nr:hypothetical protein [Clostridium sp. DJ247]MBC2580670.1 hypothetical protein [Clostridium sp. DJ247]MBC2580679.1 hypothetical protein [Clostridium sp. DJ247]
MTEIALLTIGILLIVVNINAIKRSKNSFSETLDVKEKDIKDYDVKIIQIRKEFAETILELQKEIETLKYKVSVIESNNSKKELVHKEMSIDKDSKDEHKNLSNYDSDINSSTKFKNQNDISYNINKDIEINSNNEIEKSRDMSKDKKLNISAKESIHKNVENTIKNNEKKYENNKVTDNNIKIKEITKMLEDGLSVDEISKIIGIGKGEVLLIKELYIK